MRPLTITVTQVASGATLGPIEASKADCPTGLWVYQPVGSAQVYLRGYSDQTSANFGRLLKTDASSTWVLTVTSGQALGADVTEILRGFPYVRLETSPAQTATLSAQLVFKV